MALELIVDTLDSVPEALKDMYVASEGKFKLDVNGIEDTKGLKSALEKERQAAKEAREALRKFDGIDPLKTKEFMAKFENDEEAQLIANGKIDEVFQKRTEKWRLEEERQKKELGDKIAAAESKANTYKDRVLDDAFRSAANKISDIQTGAVDEMLLGHLRTIFALDENGRAVQYNEDGSVVIGKDGKSPYSPEEYLEGCRATKPWLFKVTSSGSPATGKPQKVGGKDFSNLPPIERLTAARAAAAGRK